jgi:hypothetical protein
VGKNVAESAKGTLKERAYQQLKEFLLIAFYLWVVLALVALYRSVLSTEYCMDLTEHGLILLNALALAKVMLLAKDLHLGERFDDAPLIVPTLFKCAIFAWVLACFKILEEFAIGLFHHKTFQESIAHLGGGTWRGILTLTFLFFVVLIPLVGFGEVQRVLGSREMTQLLFHRRPT